MAAVHSPAAVVRPLTRWRRGDDDGAGADKADARHYLGAQPGHIRVIMHLEVEILTGQRGHGRPQADEDMGPKAGGPAFVLPLNADNAAADHRQQHPHGDREQRHVPQTVKNG